MECYVLDRRHECGSLGLAVLSGGSASRERAADGHRAYDGVSIASVKASAQYPGGRMYLLLNVCATT